MYLWNVKALKKSFKNETFTEIESLKYLLIAIIISFSSYLFDFVSMDFWIISSYILFISLNIMGVIYCFKKNNGKCGKDLLKILLSLGVVLIIRLTILFIIPFSIIFFIIIKSIGVMKRYPTWDLMLLTAVNTLFYYWRMGIHMKEIADSRDNLNKEENMVIKS